MTERREKETAKASRCALVMILPWHRTCRNNRFLARPSPAAPPPIRSCYAACGRGVSGIGTSEKKDENRSGKVEPEARKRPTHASAAAPLVVRIHALRGIVLIALYYIAARDDGRAHAFRARHR